MEEADAKAKEEGALHPSKVPEGTCCLGAPTVMLDVVACLPLLTPLAQVRLLKGLLVQLVPPLRVLFTQSQYGGAHLGDGVWPLCTLEQHAGLLAVATCCPATPS